MSCSPTIRVEVAAEEFFREKCENDRVMLKMRLAMRDNLRFLARFNDEDVVEISNDISSSTPLSLPNYLC